METPASVRRYDFRFAKGRVRADWEYNVLEQMPDGRRRDAIRERTLVFDGSRCYDLLRNVNGSAVTLLTRDPGAWPIFVLPQGVGMNPYLTLFCLRARTFLGSAELDLAKSTVSTDWRDSERLVKIGQCLYGGWADVSIWINQEKGFSVTRMEMVSRTTSAKTVLENTLRLYPGDVWFPARSMVVTYWDGRPESRSEWTTQSADFTVDIDDGAFTLAGMDIPPGRKVGGYLDEAGTVGVLGVWTGEEIVKADEWERRLTMRPRVFGGLPWAIPTGVGVILAAAAGYILHRRYVLNRHAG